MENLKVYIVRFRPTYGVSSTTKRITAINKEDAISQIPKYFDDMSIINVKELKPELF